MLGRTGNQIDDEPGWRERLAEFRNSPPVVFHRPGWMSESPGALLLLFGGIACAIASAMYFVIPPQSLPTTAPGYFSVAGAEKAFKATSTTTSSTTTTTISKKEIAKRVQFRKDIAADPAKGDKFWGWVAAVGNYTAQEAIVTEIVSKPRQPPFRNWSYGFLALTLATGLLGAAWFTSDSRSRRMWGD